MRQSTQRMVTLLVNGSLMENTGLSGQVHAHCERVNTMNLR